MQYTQRNILCFEFVVPITIAGTRVLIALRYKQCQSKLSANFSLLRNIPTLNHTSVLSYMASFWSSHTSKSKCHFPPFQIFQNTHKKNKIFSSSNYHTDNITEVFLSNNNVFECEWLPQTEVTYRHTRIQRFMWRTSPQYFHHQQFSILNKELI